MELDWGELFALSGLRVLFVAGSTALVLLLIARVLCRLMVRVSSGVHFASQVAAHICPPFMFFLPRLGSQTVWAAAPAETPFIGGIRHLNGLAIIGV